MKDTSNESTSAVTGPQLDDENKILRRLLHLAEEYNLVLLFLSLFATLSFLVDHFFGGCEKWIAARPLRL